MMRTAISPRFATRSFARRFGVLVTRVSSLVTGGRARSATC
jgi:hypothetical protein